MILTLELMVRFRGLHAYAVWIFFIAGLALLWLIFAGLDLYHNLLLNETVLLSTFVLLSFTIVAEELTVEFSPGIFASAGSLPILLAVFFVDPFVAGLIALFTAAISSRKLRRSSIVFNAANYTVSVAAASLIFGGLGPVLGLHDASGVSIELLVISTLASIAFLVADFSLGSIFVFLRDGLKLKESWGKNFLKAIPLQAIFIGVYLIVVAIYAKAGVTAAVLFLIPMFAGQHVYKLLVQQKELLLDQKSVSQELMDMNIGMAASLIMLLDSKDHYTASHSACVAVYCRDMAKLMGLSEDKQRIAHMAGLLHDLGKVGTPDSVLKKRGRLTPQEWEQVKQHPATAAEAISQLATHKEVAEIILHHQERYDGSGYPSGKKGDEIPSLSRMLAVADTYHALTSNRPYREAKSPFEALIILRRSAGTQLDPQFVEIMAQVLKNEDLSYREGSKADFLIEFQKDRPALKLDAIRARANEQ